MSATLTWTDPKVSAGPATITDKKTLEELAQIFSGYDGPPPKGPVAEAPMHDVVITLQKRDGSRSDIKVYWAKGSLGVERMWRHPQGQLILFDGISMNDIARIVEGARKKGE